MFCPNEAAISTLGNSSRLMMEYAIEKKITLVGPAMLYFTLKTVEYYWRAEKQSKNTQQVIKLAEERYLHIYLSVLSVGSYSKLSLVICER